ncbi:tyrosine-type recombinase/integrase [Streptococcus toyakuensis]|uniref:tyrosine-type recombinase/integrase n=1 Tax=Streptococcus toyakuensis TaxID=2819619 RepID=UPI0036F3AFBF
MNNGGCITESPFTLIISRSLRTTKHFSIFLSQYPNNKTLATRLNTRFKHAGVPNIGFHGFRHTHASLLLNSGIPYKELQHRLGHSTLAMTMDTYSHLSKEKAKTAVSFYEKAVSSL